MRLLGIRGVAKGLAGFQFLAAGLPLMVMSER